MFDFFRKKTARDFMADAKENYGLPEAKEIPPMPAVPPKPKEKDANIFYRFGLTDNDRVAFSMGYSEITMNREGCQQLIDQIAFFMNQLPEDNDVEEASDSDDTGTTKD